MLSEATLIFIAVVGACALLVLGILELLWPSAPRRRRAVPQTATAPAPLRVETSPVATAAPPPAADPALPTRKRRSKVSPHARSHAGQTDRSGERVSLPTGVPPAPMARPPAFTREPGSAPTTRAPAEPAREIVAAETPPPGSREPRPGPAPATTPGIDPLLVERCFALYEDRHYDEVVSAGEEALARLRSTPRTTPEAHETAALWSVVALAKQALGDDVGASVALESALAAAPAAERVTYLQHIAALALTAGRTALMRAESHDGGDRIAELRSARAWIERGLGAVPSDERLRELGKTVRAELWPAYEHSAHRLLQRQEFREARRVLREALEDPEIPAARVASFEELLSGTLGGEIGQLTAQAIRSVQEARESEALASLRRAEELLATASDEALPPKRREEVDQRLWWGYTRLGVRRLEAGDYEEALDPLVRALKLTDVSPDRQAETRAALVRALEGVADVRAVSIRQLTDDGDRDGAVLRTETLRDLLRSCMELGLSADELSVAFKKTRRLCAELGLEDRA